MKKVTRNHGHLLALILGIASAETAFAQPRQQVNEAEALRQEMMAREVAMLKEQLERSLLAPDGSVAGARQRFDAQLTSQLREIDQTCKLSSAQKKKLQLAGRGDIKRFFDRYEELKLKFAEVEPVEQKMAAIQQGVSSFRLTHSANLFHEESLLIRSLAATLTDEQFARYEELAKERRDLRHRNSVRTAVTLLERNLGLAASKRDELIKLLAESVTPSRRQSPYDHYRILIQLGRLPQDKLRRIFTPVQMNQVTALVNQYQATEQRLRAAGLWPEDDEGVH